MEKSDETIFVDCPIAGVQKIVRGKWNMVILYFLHQQTLRFGELSRKLPTVTFMPVLRALEQFADVYEVKQA